jgi:hypothetical protein
MDLDYALFSSRPLKAPSGCRTRRRSRPRLPRPSRSSAPPARAAGRIAAGRCSRGCGRRRAMGWGRESPRGLTPRRTHPCQGRSATGSAGNGSFRARLRKLGVHRYTQLDRYSRKHLESSGEPGQYGNTSCHCRQPLRRDRERASRASPLRSADPLSCGRPLTASHRRVRAAPKSPETTSATDGAPEWSRTSWGAGLLRGLADYRRAAGLTQAPARQGEAVYYFDPNARDSSRPAH